MNSTESPRSTKYNTEGFPTPPSTGERAVDVDQDDEPMVRVVESLDQTADEYVLYETEMGNEETVADYHRGRYPADDRVVLVVYETSIQQYEEQIGEDLDRDWLLELLRRLGARGLEHHDGPTIKTYAFPESRLGWYNE